METRPALVVIDTLGNLAHPLVGSAGENDAAAWTPIMTEVARIARDSDAGVILLHHAQKAVDSYRGSTAIGAGVDMILTMTEPAAEEGSDDRARRLIKARGRWQLEAYAVRYTQNGFLLADGHAPIKQRTFDVICVLGSSLRSRRFISSTNSSATRYSSSLPPYATSPEMTTTHPSSW